MLFNQKDRINLRVSHIKAASSFASRFSLKLGSGILCMLLILPSVHSAEVYKYIDEKGRVQYSDHPTAYRQNNFKPGQENTAYDKKSDRIDINNINGPWKLVGQSKHLGDETLPASGKWEFFENGSLAFKHNKDISTTKYRSQGRLLEIVQSGNWNAYHIVSLSRKRLVIRQGKSGEYFYFDRTSTSVPLPKSMRVSSLYRRDQVSKLVVMFSCTGIKFSELSDTEKKEKRQEIFTTTGIENFNENIYNDSLEHYKKDAIYNDQYNPKIQAEIKKCLVPNFNAK